MPLQPNFGRETPRRMPHNGSFLICPRPAKAQLLPHFLIPASAFRITNLLASRRGMHTPVMLSMTIVPICAPSDEEIIARGAGFPTCPVGKCHFWPSSGYSCRPSASLAPASPEYLTAALVRPYLRRELHHRRPSLSVLGDFRAARSASEGIGCVPRLRVLKLHYCVFSRKHVAWLSEPSSEIP